MYTCKRLGENATEFKYSSVDGGASGAIRSGNNANGGMWTRAVTTAAGASLFLQSLASRGSTCTGALGLALVLGCLLWSVGCRSKVREESLLVVRELGVQVTTKYVDGREKSTVEELRAHWLLDQNIFLFLDKAKIKAILINEGITMHRVVFYLAFVVEGRKQMVVAFEHLKPRLHILVKIYRGTRAAILGEAEEDPPVEHQGGTDRTATAAAGSGMRGLYRGVEGEARGSLRTRRTDRIARRQRHTTEAASALGTGWPPPHAHVFS